MSSFTTISTGDSFAVTPGSTVIVPFVTTGMGFRAQAPASVQLRAKCSFNNGGLPTFVALKTELQQQTVTGWVTCDGVNQNVYVPSSGQSFVNVFQQGFFMEPNMTYRWRLRNNSSLDLVFSEASATWMQTAQ